MTGPEHYREAEKLLAEITNDDGVDFGDGGEAYVAAAQVHATLALAAATALMAQTDTCWSGTDVTEWAQAASKTKPAGDAR